MGARNFFLRCAAFSKSFLKYFHLGQNQHPGLKLTAVLTFTQESIEYFGSAMPSVSMIPLSLQPLNLSGQVAGLLHSLVVGIVHPHMLIIAAVSGHLLQWQ